MRHNIHHCSEVCKGFVKTPDFKRRRSPSVGSISIKDGVSWSEVSGKPAGFADNVDDVAITGETDPQVGSNITGYVPKWNGSALATVRSMTMVISASEPTLLSTS